MLLRHRGRDPIIDPSAFVAPTATLVGDVRVGPRATAHDKDIIVSHGDATPSEL
jgi:carbonic anhydrase/acetyltransferase-like protein (isoleucine patch superfamily)